jgi:hypothetical protein
MAKHTWIPIPGMSGAERSEQTWPHHAVAVKYAGWEMTRQGRNGPSISVMMVLYQGERRYALLRHEETPPAEEPEA